MSLYIARRTGGGRGVYEVAGHSSAGLSAIDVAERELILNLAPYAIIHLGIIIRVQGGKPRLILLDNSTIHIQRQTASILLMPKPIRADIGMGDQLPIL